MFSVRVRKYSFIKYAIKCSDLTKRVKVKFLVCKVIIN